MRHLKFILVVLLLTSYVCGDDLHLTQSTLVIFSSNSKEIILSNKNIKSIDLKAFSNFRKLAGLRLDENKLDLLEQPVFKSLNKLIILDLYANKLKKIGLKTFYGLVSLKYLLLNSNKITSIDSYAFSELKSLVYLDLSSNLLTEIDYTLFRGLFSIKWLKMESNEIVKISKNTFRNLQSLERVCLYNNIISKKIPSILLRNINNSNAKYVIEFNVPCSIKY